jgi:hypothetical protein
MCITGLYSQFFFWGGGSYTEQKILGACGSCVHSVPMKCFTRSDAGITYRSVKLSGHKASIITKCPTASE